MATTPLVLTNPVVTIASTVFTDAVSAITIAGAANEVAIPATGSTPESVRRGSVKYTCALDYFSNDTSLTAELFSVLWTALTDSAGNGQLTVVASLHGGTISATNPSWTFTIVVTEASLGGKVGDLSADSQTFTMTGPPVRATS